MAFGRATGICQSPIWKKLALEGRKTVAGRIAASECRLKYFCKIFNFFLFFG